MCHPPGSGVRVISGILYILYVDSSPPSLTSYVNRYIDGPDKVYTGLYSVWVYTGLSRDPSDGKCPPLPTPHTIAGRNMHSRPTYVSVKKK